MSTTRTLWGPSGVLVQGNLADKNTIQILRRHLSFNVQLPEDPSAFESRMLINGVLMSDAATLIGGSESPDDVDPCAALRQVLQRWTGADDFTCSHQRFIPLNI